MTERLQKILSQAGFGSRRTMETWIRAGRVHINGQRAEIGNSVTAKDNISVDGKLIKNPLAQETKTRVLLYHKPVGEICSRHDPKHSHTVFDNLPRLQEGRWIQIGRLDINTSGLLVFTNNGELANRLMHPKFACEREYAVRVSGTVTKDALDNLKKGVTLEDGPAKFNTVTYRGGEGRNAWYHVTLSEGKNREVRRLWQSQGVEVSRLIRIRFGNIVLPRALSRGDWIELKAPQVQEIIRGL